MDAPERIWAKSRMTTDLDYAMAGTRYWEESSAYVRADVHQKAEAERDAALAAVARLDGNRQALEAEIDDMKLQLDELRAERARAALKGDSHE